MGPHLSVLWICCAHKTSSCLFQFLRSATRTFGQTKHGALFVHILLLEPDDGIFVTVMSKKWAHMSTNFAIFDKSKWKCSSCRNTNQSGSLLVVAYNLTQGDVMQLISDTDLLVEVKCSWWLKVEWVSKRWAFSDLLKAVVLNSSPRCQPTGHVFRVALGWLYNQLVVLKDSVQAPR